MPLLQSNEDIYVSPQLIKKYALRKGDVIGCFVKPNPEERNDPAYEIDFINWMKPEEAKNRPYFDELIPFYPTEKFELENPDDDDVSMRVVDLFVPIGKGQRGLIVSPPRAGKTVLLQKIAKSIRRIELCLQENGLNNTAQEIRKSWDTWLQKELWQKIRNKTQQPQGENPRELDEKDILKRYLE